MNKIGYHGKHQLPQSRQQTEFNHKGILLWLNSVIIRVYSCLFVVPSFAFSRLPSPFSLSFNSHPL